MQYATEQDDIREMDCWDLLWGRRDEQDPSYRGLDHDTQYLDVIHHELVLAMCPHPRPAERADGEVWLCPECSDQAWELVWGPVANLMSESGRAAYWAGRKGQDEVLAAEHAIRGAVPSLSEWFAHERARMAAGGVWVDLGNGQRRMAFFNAGDPQS